MVKYSLCTLSDVGPHHRHFSYLIVRCLFFFVVFFKSSVYGH